MEYLRSRTKLIILFFSQGNKTLQSFHSDGDPCARSLRGEGGGVWGVKDAGYAQVQPPNEDYNAFQKTAGQTSATEVCVLNK